MILESAAYRKGMYVKYFKDANIDSYTNPDVKRKLKILKNIGTAALDDIDLTALNAARNRMSQTYNNAKICPFNRQNCDHKSDDALSLDPDIETLMASSTDYDEMKWIWEQWREKSGKLMRADYKQYVDLMNKAAKLNSYRDAGEMWRAEYEDDRLREIIDRLWVDVSPLYNELHKYVHTQLKRLYGTKMDLESENIPAHLLGNMWVSHGTRQGNEIFLKNIFQI